jgi:hypothetical protein
MLPLACRYIISPTSEPVGPGNMTRGLDAGEMRRSLPRPLMPLLEFL